MKKILGALAAAVLLGTGCAHEQATPTDTGMSSPPQASADSTRGNGLSCAVIGSRSTGAKHSDTVKSGSDQGTVVGQAPENAAIGNSPAQASPSEDTGIGGSSSQAGTSEATELGTPSPQVDTSPQTTKNSSAAKPDTFEDTGMGGAGGGGG